MAIPKLTTGCIFKILSGVDVDKPVLQILSFKRIPNTDGERYRLLISDGQYLNSFAMLASQLNSQVSEGKITENTIIRVDKYITSSINKSERGERKILVILEINILQEGSIVGNKIGSPVNLTDEQLKNAPPSVAPVANQTNNRPTGMNNATSNAFAPVNNSNISMSQHSTLPIASLSPYQNKWMIKARVTSKTPIRTWNNNKGEGKLFSFDLMDESSEIRVTAFKEQCDRFFDVIQVDKIYFISKCQLKTANKQYTSIKNDYELTLTGETTIDECMDSDEANGVPTVKYEFKKIADIAEMETNSMVDLIAICRDAGEIRQFTAKTTGRDLKKRDITLVDTSNASIFLTLWGDDAVNFDGVSQPVILLKNARLNEFGGGKTLNYGSSTTMKINPDMREGHQLRGWFDNGGADKEATSLSSRTGTVGTSFNTEWINFHEVKLRNLGNGDKPDYFQVKAIINLVKKDTAFYKACPTPDCNKKVIDIDGLYRCEKCNNEFPSFKYRLLLNANIGDWTGNRWVTCFSDVAEKLFEKNSEEVGQAIEQKDDSIFSSLYFKALVYKIRVKIEHYADTPRFKFSVMSVAPINYKEYNRHLLTNLERLTGLGKN